MGDPNITMEEYIRLEEEKAHRRGKVYNWETATYGKIWYDEDVHDLRSVETEFPAIVFKYALTSEVALSCEPTVSPLNDKQIDFRISFDDSDDEDYTVCLRTCLEPDEWIKDSGCSKHMTGNKSLFSTYKAYDGEHVDNLAFNLLSVGQICDNKCQVLFMEEDSEIIKDGKIIGNGIRKNGLYGNLNFFLGLQIKQMEDEIFFNQSKYIKEMLKKLGLEDSKPTKTPMSTEIKLTKDDEANSVDITKYRGEIMPRLNQKDYQLTKAYLPRIHRSKAMDEEVKESYRRLESRLFHKGRFVTPSFIKTNNMLLTFQVVGLEPFFTLNKPICPRFVTQFYHSLEVKRDEENNPYIEFKLG
ncbi:retrovirus-related pol polyprotein from transposon TNT 1-94 [Tanacetum coccineum]